MNPLSFIFFLLYLAPALASSSANFGNDDPKWVEFLQNYPANLSMQMMLKEIITDQEMGNSLKMYVIPLLIVSGADMRTALIEALHNGKSRFKEMGLYLEFAKKLLLSMARFVVPYDEEDAVPIRTLYECLASFDHNDESFLDAFHLIADIESYPPSEREIHMFTLITDERQIGWKTRLVLAYLDHPKNLPVFNNILVFSWTHKLEHYRLPYCSLIPNATCDWFDPVKPALAAGKHNEVFAYVIQCRRLGSSLLEKIQEEIRKPTGTTGRYYRSIVMKSVLQHVAEDIPAKFRDVLFVLLISGNFPTNARGEALDTDLNSYETCSREYGLRDIDAKPENGVLTFRQMIMKARNLRAKHAAFIKSMMELGDGLDGVLQGTCSVLMKMIALETGHFI